MTRFGLDTSDVSQLWGQRRLGFKGVDFSLHITRCTRLRVRHAQDAQHAQHAPDFAFVVTDVRSIRIIWSIATTCSVQVCEGNLLSRTNKTTSMPRLPVKQPEAEQYKLLPARSTAAIATLTKLPVTVRCSSSCYTKEVGLGWIQANLQRPASGYSTARTAWTSI
ncbi:hypothetical protein HaLaN_16797, partial [Haematococcus lacustris]